MVALAVVLSVVVLLLAVLVAGLLRSHADILKALHELGVGVGEPSGDDAHDHGGQPGPHHRTATTTSTGHPNGPIRHRAWRGTSVPLTMGPPLPGNGTRRRLRPLPG